MSIHSGTRRCKCGVKCSFDLHARGYRRGQVPVEATDALVERLNQQKGIIIDYCVIDAANHFFKDNIDDIVMHMHDHMNGRKGGRPVTARLARAA